MTTLNIFKKRVINEIEAKLKPRLIEISDWLHDNPEIGSEEQKAAELLTSELERHGFALEKNLLNMSTAFKATFQGEKEGPTISFLAEYDALPEIGHACGHNIIGTSAIGAGIATSRLIEELGGTIIVLGCPAEEGHGLYASSKCKMVKGGVFDDIDFALMLHPFDNWAVGSPALAITGLEIEFRGKTVNPAVAPEKGVNALAAALITFDSIDHMRQQLKREVHPVVYGIIIEGGVAPNVMPNRVICQFGMRASEDDYLDVIVNIVKNCAQGASIATGAEVKITEREDRLPTKKHNKILQNLLYKNFRILGVNIEDPLVSLSSVPRASTDFSCVTHILPSVEARVAIGPSGITTHTQEFEEATISENGHNALIIGTKVLTMTAVDLLVSSEIRKKAKDAFIGK